MKNLRKSIFALIIALPLIFTACTKQIPGPQGEKGDKGDKGDPVGIYSYTYEIFFLPGQTSFKTNKDIPEYNEGDVFLFYTRTRLDIINKVQRYSPMPFTQPKDTTTIVPNNNDLPVLLTPSWEKNATNSTITFNINASNGTLTTPVWKSSEAFEIKVVLVKIKK